MELRSYAKTIWRHIWIVILITGIVTLYAGYQYYHLEKTPGALKAYQSTVTMRIGLQATNRSTDQYYSDYVTTSELMADELVSGPLLTSNEFTTHISQQIQSDMGPITQRFGPHPDLGDWQTASTISAALTSAHIHTLVTVNVLWSTPAGAWAIANAIGEVGATQISTYLDYEVRSTPSLSQPDLHPLVSAQVISGATNPALVAGVSANKPALLLVLLIVALVIGIALAFLIDYLDDRLHSKDEIIQLLQLPVYGEIPHPSSKRKNTPHSPSVA